MTVKATTTQASRRTPAKKAGPPAAASAALNVRFFPPAAPPEEGDTPAVPPDDRLKYEAVVEWLQVGGLSRDESVNTRPVDDHWVNGKAKVFDWMLLGSLTVSRRADGSNVLLDGQQRAALVRKVAGPGAQVKCEVITGLSRRQEAEMFMGLNANRPVNAVAKFLASVTAGDQVAMSVNQVVTRAGWVISPSTGPAHLTCVNRLLGIHRADLVSYGAGGPEPSALIDVLNTVNAAWGRDADKAGHEAIIWALGRLFLRDGKRLRTTVRTGQPAMQWLTESIRSAGSSPDLLLTSAAALASMAKPSLSLNQAVLNTITQTYNYRTPAPQRIAEFRPRGAK